jgi:hypothetical protein
LRRQEEWVGWVSGLGGLAIAGTLGYAYVHFQPEPRDEESLCLRSAASASAVTEVGHHLLLVDKTDKWTAPQGARLRSIIIAMHVFHGIHLGLIARRARTPCSITNNVDYRNGRSDGVQFNSPPRCFCACYRPGYRSQAEAAVIAALAGQTTFEGEAG